MIKIEKALTGSDGIKDCIRKRNLFGRACQIADIPSGGSGKQLSLTNLLCGKVDTNEPGPVWRQISGQNTGPGSKI